MKKRDPLEIGKEVERDWIARARSTAPVDRDVVEDAVRRFYDTAGFGRLTFQWASSPLDGMVKAASQLANNLTRKVMSHFNDAEAKLRISPTVKAKLTHLLDNRLMAMCPATTKVEAMELSLRVSALESDQKVLGDAIRAALDVSPSLLAIYDFMRQAYGTSTEVDALVDVSSVGWFWFFSGTVIISERPSKISLDNAGLLHCDDGPAVEYADGFSVCARHNVWVPENQVSGNGADWKEIEEVGHTEVQRAVVGSKIDKWSKDTAATEEAKAERDEAAEAVLLLGGVGGVRDLINSGE